VTANVGDVLSAFADAQLIAEGFPLVLNDAGHEIDAPVIATQCLCVTLRLRGDYYGPFPGLACLLTGSGRDMFLTQLDNKTLLKHQQAAAEMGGTHAGRLPTHPRDGTPPRGVFGTSPETKNIIIDVFTDNEFLPLFREVPTNYRSAIEAVEVVQGLQEQRRAARRATYRRGGARCHCGATG
jgi:hypothetical protein